jgi:hypothetical protein
LCQRSQICEFIALEKSSVSWKTLGASSGVEDFRPFGTYGFVK